MLSSFQENALSKSKDTSATKNITLGSDRSVTMPSGDDCSQKQQDNHANMADKIRNGLRCLAKPGVQLRRKKNVPLYYVSDEDSSIYIRELNGQVDRGQYVDGVFRVIEQ